MTCNNINKNCTNVLECSRNRDILFFLSVLVTYFIMLSLFGDFMKVIRVERGIIILFLGSLRLDSLTF